MSTNDTPQDDATVAAILASIGRQVRAARLGHDWHLTDLATRVNLSPSVICRLELARRALSIHQLITVCAALGLRPSDLLRAEHEAFPWATLPGVPDRRDRTGRLGRSADELATISAIDRPSSLPQ